VRDPISGEIELEEIVSKGASDARLIDYGITNDSTIFIESYMDQDSIFYSNLKKNVSLYMGGASCNIKRAGDSENIKPFSVTNPGLNLNQFMKEDYI
jgi:hypothetical protein